MENKNIRRFIILNFFTSSHCMMTQMCLSIAISYIFSNSIFVFSFFIGLYLMSMGLGVLLIEHIQPERLLLKKTLIINSLIGVLLANPGIIGLLFFNELLFRQLRIHQIDLFFLIFPLGILFSIAIGIVSGAEMPLFSKLIESEKWKTTNPLIGVLVSDYFGSFSGIILFTVILYPFIGLFGAIFISQIVTLLAIIIVYLLTKMMNKNYWFLSFLFLLLFLVILMLLFRNNLLEIIDNLSIITQVN